MTLSIVNDKSSYFVAPHLARHWDKISLEYLKKINSDRVYIVDGTERSGKSWFAMQQAGYLDKEMFKSPKEFVKRICFTPEEFFRAVRTVRNGVIIFDEAFRGFSSRAALSKVNKKLIQALMEMGQNNNIVFIVLPSFFLLDIYPAMLRSNGLFNIYINKKSGKRCFRLFNRADKNKIYQSGIKRGWSYNMNTRFKGNFYNKFPGDSKESKEFQKAYDAKKRRALIEMDKEPEKTENSKYLDQRNTVITLFKEYGKLTGKDLENMFKKEKMDLSARNITQIVADYRKKREKG